MLAHVLRATAPTAPPDDDARAREGAHAMKFLQQAFQMCRQLIDVRDTLFRAWVPRGLYPRALPSERIVEIDAVFLALAVSSFRAPFDAPLLTEVAVLQFSAHAGSNG